MEKIRVLHYGLSANMGGIETYLLRLAERIDRSRFELHFLISKNEPCCFFSELEALGCYFHLMTPRRESIAGNRRDLDFIFRNNVFDIFHIHLNSLSYIVSIAF